MLEPAVVLLRLIQYIGAMILMGSSHFFIYALPPAGEASAARTGWARPLLVGAAALLAISALLGLLAQTCVMAGSISEGLKRESLQAVAVGMDLGKAAVARAVIATAAVILLLVLKPGRAAWVTSAILGVLATGSFAWMGHGAGTEGAGKLVHLASDIIHGWAAAIWVGALVAFFLLLRATHTSATAAALHRALHGFSGIGALLVAVLMASGLVNSWFLVGLDGFEGMWTTGYGRLFSVKLTVFAVMLMLAAANRFRLTPRLARSIAEGVPPEGALEALRRSIALESALGVLALALVAWFGTLAPPSAL